MAATARRADTGTESDHETLVALNRDYIASVQSSDVARFEEILAADFLCSHPDGSLVDRATFLAQTARPVAIRDLAAEDVVVRLMGDFAIIHAATRYLKPAAPRAAAATPTSGRAGTGAGSASRRM